MNILLIGNGFDLAHGLPTKYEQFLDFASIILEIVSKKKFDRYEIYKLLSTSDVWKNLNSNIKAALIHDFFQNDINQISERVFFWQVLIIKNLWFDYFFENRKSIKKNWTDFESEIGFVITELENYISKASNNYNSISGEFFLPDHYYNDLPRNFKVLQKTYLSKYVDITKVSLNLFVSELEKDLEKLIFAFEIYISEYVNSIKVDKINFDIEKLKINKVISFNYSDTFERVYAQNYANKIEYDYIHGKAIKHENYNKNKLVLGINEYLSENEKNSNIRFIRFKKYFQRIHKKTGSAYIDWLNTINDYTDENGLFIFGHSLDETDGDVLRKLILNTNINTTIFYKDRRMYAQQIANLVKVIGQDNLINFTGGSKGKIQFIEQST